jgi:cytosine deaminase
LYDLVLHAARLLGRSNVVDVAISNGRDMRVAPEIDEALQPTVDLGGRLLIPGFVDAHLHLDKAFLNDDPSFSGKTGSAFFETLRRAKREWTVPSLTERMRRALAAATAYGTTSVRAQVDIDDIVGLRGIEAALSLRSERATLQIVAFPHEGLGRADLRAALRLGADVVGGGAVFDDLTTETHVQGLFDLATEFDVDLDIHADLQTPPTAPLAEWKFLTSPAPRGMPVGSTA